MQNYLSVIRPVFIQGSDRGLAFKGSLLKREDLGFITNNAVMLMKSRGTR